MRADVAQLVEHHLAKVGVAGSNPVVRSRWTCHNSQYAADGEGRGMARRLLRSAGFLLTTGAISVFWSESMFWSRPRPGDTLGGYVGAILGYSLVAYPALWLARRFGSSDRWRVFLLGAVFGWLLEGAVVNTVYASLPFSISFTGLAWHASITVLFGWWFLPKLLRSGEPRRIVAAATLAGLVEGAWSIGWWVEDTRVTSVPEFALWVTSWTVGLALTYLVWDLLWPPADLLRSRAGIRVSGVVLYSFVLLHAGTGTPVAALLLPALVGLAVWSLLRDPRPDDPLLGRHEVIRAEAVACLAAFPAAAVASYMAAEALDLRIATNIAVYLVTMPLGFALFGLAVAKTRRVSARRAAT